MSARLAIVAAVGGCVGSLGWLLLSEAGKSWVASVPAATASAWATVVQAVVVVFALIFAFFQLREARRAREATERPFVVLDFALNPASPHLVDLIITNLGPSIARDVSFEIVPALKSSVVDASGFAIFDRTIPTLVPGKQIALLYDSMVERKRRFESEDEHAPVHLVTIRYRGDVRRKHYTETVQLDLSVMLGIQFVTVHGLHDLVREVERIRETVKHWSAGFDGIHVRLDSDLRRDAEVRAERAKEHRP